jgi:hypothetical protein
VQLFGLNYRGIIDPTDLKWYTAILEECKSLDMNDFLHNVSPYVVNRTLPPQQAASSNVSDSSRPAAVPCRRLVETDIFRLGEMARERSSAPRQDTPNLGTFLGEGSRKFNQFGIMRGEMRRDPDVFSAEEGNPVSSSREYQSQYPMGSSARRGGQFRSQKKSRLQPFHEQGETLDLPTAGAPLTEHSNEVGGGAQSSPPRRSSPASWSGNSSPNKSGGAAFEPPSHHPEDDDNAGDEQPPTALSHPTEMEVDNLAAAPHPLSGEVVPDKPPSPSSGAQPPSEAGAIQDDDARVDVVDEKGKEKVEEKKKEAVFFKGVELVDMDDCDVPDLRLQCDSDDTDDDDSPNPEDMDVGDGGASSSQCLEPNLGLAPESVQSAIPVHSGHPFEATPSVLDPLFNAAGKAPHPDAVIVKQEASWFQFHEEKCQRKAAEKLALQQEKDQIAKEREDSRRTIAYLQELLHKKLGGNIDILLAGNPGVPITKPSLSTPAPSLQGVPSVAFPVARGATGS